MVKRPLFIGILMSSAVSAFHSWLPKDTTTAWCLEKSINGIGITEWYDCYPNPLGVDRMSYWWQIPDSLQVNGCLLDADASLFNETIVFPDWNVVAVKPTIWYEFSESWWVGPLAPRITLAGDEYCVRHAAQLGVVFNLTPGDSIRLVYKMTPWDTAVADTIRGEMKAYYRGLIPTTQTSRFLRSRRSSAIWHQGAILLSRPERGPFELLDLRGHILSTRDQIDGPRTRVIPSNRPSPGLYHLRWPGGHAGVVVPR